MAEKQVYCAECGGYRTFHTLVRTEFYQIKNDPVEIEAKIAVCDDCGEEVVHLDLEQDNLLTAHMAYRQKYNLLLPEEIAALRQHYGFGQRKFARLLGWGDVTVHRYEAGALQDVGHNQVMRLLQDPYTMLKLLHDRQTMLKPREYQQATEVAKQAMRIPEQQREWVGLACEITQSKLNGKRSLALNKLFALSAYFAGRQQQGIDKYHLAHLLWYTDMLHYRQSGQSLSGSGYIKSAHGPLPHRYQLLIGQMDSEGIIGLTLDASGGEAIQTAAAAGVELEVEECELAMTVWQSYSQYSREQWQQLWRRETGIKKTGIGDMIPYRFAKDIQLQRL